MKKIQQIFYVAFAKTDTFSGTIIRKEFLVGKQVLELLPSFFCSCLPILGLQKFALMLGILAACFRFIKHISASADIILT